MSAWYGYMPNVITDESFIMYVTSGAVNKTSVISGTKFHNPQMFLRTWAYADNKGDLLIDKKYRGNGTGTTAMIEFICQWLEDKFGAHCDYEKELREIFIIMAEELLSLTHSMDYTSIVILLLKIKMIK